MDAYAQAQAATQAGTVRRALAVEGGHLFIGHNGAVSFRLLYAVVVEGPMLDETDVANARLIAAAPRLRAAPAALIERSARTGDWDARRWKDAHGRRRRRLLDPLTPSWRPR